MERLKNLAPDKNEQWKPSGKTVTLKGSWNGKRYEYKMDENKIENLIDLSKEFNIPLKSLLGIAIYEGREDMGNNNSNSFNPTKIGAGNLKKYRSYEVIKNLEAAYNQSSDLWNNKEIYNTSINPAVTAAYIATVGLENYNPTSALDPKSKIKGQTLYLSAVEQLGSDVLKQIEDLNLGSSKSIYSNKRAQ